MRLLTTALTLKEKIPNGRSNGKLEHYQFGSNVLLDIPNYQNKGDYESNGHSSNIILRLFIRDRFCNVPLQKCDFSKCERCNAREYNPRIEEHLCYDPIMCPAINPAMTIHETFASCGHRANDYSKAREAINAGINYA